MAYSLTYTFNSDSSSYSVTGYSGINTSDRVVIPSTYNDGTNGEHLVTSIDDSVFNLCGELTNITIPDSVTRIGSSAFKNCKGLTSVTIGNGVTSIGNSAFSGCGSLTSITIPDSVTNIYDLTFQGCSSLANINIPDSVTSINGGAFMGCTNLTSITIPNSVTSIGGNAFDSCSSLTSINIPDSVTSISMAMFRNCTSLTSITIHDNITSIGSSAFRGCSGLTSIIIPSSVASIGITAFHGCSNLIQLILLPSAPPTLLASNTIPDNVQSIYVQQSSKAAYRAATNWKTFATRLVSDNIYLSFVRFNQKNKEYINEKINNAAINIVQTTGNSETDVMSQKAVTNNFLPATIDEIAYYNVDDALRFNRHVSFSGSSAPTFINGFQISMDTPILYGSPDGNNYVYAPSETGRMAVEPNSNPTETSIVTVSSTGTHAYKKVSELVDTTSEQEITGVKTFRQPNDSDATQSPLCIEMYDEHTTTKTYTCKYGANGVLWKDDKGEIYTLYRWYEPEIPGTSYRFGIVPDSRPSTSSLPLYEADGLVTWKPVSELGGSGGNALKVTVW